MQGQWYFLYHSKTNAFWMCDTDVARIGDLRCRQCNAITEDNGLLFFGPCTSHRQHHFEYSLRNHKRAVGVRLTRTRSATTGEGARRGGMRGWSHEKLRRTPASGWLHRLIRRSEEHTSELQSLTNLV